MITRESLKGVLSFYLVGLAWVLVAAVVYGAVDRFGGIHLPIVPEVIAALVAFVYTCTRVGRFPFSFSLNDQVSPHASSSAAVEAAASSVPQESVASSSGEDLSLEELHRTGGEHFLKEASNEAGSRSVSKESIDDVMSNASSADNENDEKSVSDIANELVIDFEDDDSEDAGIDFELDDENFVKFDLEFASDAAEAFADGEPGDLEFGSEDEDDIIATKLDLAEAYIDMGDADGAQEILNEVLEEGTPEQQEEARAKLDGFAS